MRETRRDYARPYRPWPLRAAHAVLEPLGSRVLPALDPEALVRDARRAEGLTDLGPPDVLEPLGRLVESIGSEARLHPVGHLATRTRIVGSLRNRLRAEALFEAHPEILGARLPDPVVITGLQRTGTTLLHRLLGADPRFRALRSWEGLNPAPFRGRVRGEDPRIAFARRAEGALAWMAPDFFAVHPVEADGLEEDVLLIDMSLLSTVPEATLRVPSFSAWLEAQDQRPAYETLARFLKLLHWQRPADRWLLKTPHHLEWLDALFDVFPGARVIHTHRDPAATVASFCSMVAHGRGVMSDHVDPVEIGRDWGRKVGRMVDRAMAVREARSDEGFHDVRYDDLVADPMGTVARIYAFLDLDLPAEVRTAIEAKLAASPRHRYGRHVYAAEDFGLTEAGIRERFADYRARHLA